MERQKVFWVVLSVSVFVVVVLVVGAFLLRPRSAGSVVSAPGMVSPLSDPGTQVYEYQREAPAGSSAGQGAGGQSSGNTETLHFYIGEGQGTTDTTKAAPGASPSLAPAASRGAALAPAAAPVASAAPARTAAALPQQAPAARTPAGAKPAPRSTEYWIQTGSYRSQTKAEELASLLGDRGLSGRVFSFASEGSTWYRVRVGPYTSKGEAGKFLTEVRKLQGLGASYIAQVGPARQPVN